MAVLAGAMLSCALVPSEAERLRVERMESAVVPMANAALEAGQAETAQRLYRRLLDLDAESFPASMGLGDVALRRREPGEAARWYLAAAAKAKSSEDRHAAWLAHGRAALTAGRLDAARESFERLVDPQEEASPANVGWGHNGIGLILLLEGDLDNAVASMERAVLAQPDELRFDANLTRALALNNRSPELEEPADAPDGESPAEAVPTSAAAGAAAALEPLGSGEWPSVLVVSEPVDETEVLFLQAGAYAHRPSADEVASELARRTGHPARVTEIAAKDGTPLYRVRIGPFEADSPLINEVLGVLEQAPAQPLN